MLNLEISSISYLSESFSVFCTNYRSFSIRYGKENEKKIIAWLEKQDSVKGYITGLIEADMEKSKAEKKTARKAPAKKTAAKKK